MPPKTKFTWRAGARISLDPEAVGTEISELYDDRGTTTPDAVIARASDPDSAMHSHFEWDDAVAAQEHRREQARLLLRSIRIVAVGSDEPQLVNVAVRMAPDEPRVYQLASEAVKDRDLWAQVWNDTVTKLEGLDARLGELERVEQGKRLATVRRIRAKLATTREEANASLDS